MAYFNPGRMESVFYSLSELKHEKLCLAQKLQELKSHRQTLEQEFEQASVKFGQVQEKHNRMSETHAIAQQKVDEIQSLFHNIEGKINDNKPEMDNIQKTIEEEKGSQTQNLLEFESCISTISSELFSARDFYKDKALMNEINRSKVMCDDVDQRKNTEKTTIQDLTHKFNKLMEDEKLCQPCIEIEGASRVIISALERDKQEVYDYLQRLKVELESVHDALKNAQASG